MSKHQLLTVDTLDDRREVYHLLARLSPVRRVRYLESVCARTTLPNTQVHPKLSADTYRWMRAAVAGDSGADDRLTLDCYLMLWQLGSANYRLNLAQMLGELEQWGRRT